MMELRDSKENKMAKIKICGLIQIDDIMAVNQYQPDYIGFVFAKKSRRYVTVQQATKLRQQLSAAITVVGVFVNEPKEQVAELLNKNIIHIAQLHGNETEQEICWIRHQTGKPVIKAVSINTTDDAARWQESSADYLLFDNGAGGTGTAFDWSLLTEYHKPYFLAGGIHSGNLAAALTKGAYAIDVSSGVETNGKKDPVKIAEIMKMVRWHNTHADSCAAACVN